MTDVAGSPARSHSSPEGHAASAPTTAARFAAEGADVVVADFDLVAAEETAAAIGGRAVRCDVTSRETSRRRSLLQRSQRAGSTSSSPAPGTSATTCSTR